MVKEKLRMQVKLERDLNAGGRLGISQLENCLGRVRGENASRFRVVWQLNLPSLWLLLLSQGPHQKPRESTWTIDEQGPDMMPFAAIIVTVCSDSNVVSLTYLEAVKI